MTAFIHEFRARMLEAYSRSLLLARQSDAVIFMRDGVHDITVKGGWLNLRRVLLCFILLIS